MWVEMGGRDLVCSVHAGCPLIPGDVVPSNQKDYQTLVDKNGGGLTRGLSRHGIRRRGGNPNTRIDIGGGAIIRHDAHCGRGGCEQWNTGTGDLG